MAAPGERVSHPYTWDWRSMRWVARCPEHGTQRFRAGEMPCPDPWVHEHALAAAPAEPVLADAWSDTVPEDDTPRRCLACGATDCAHLVRVLAEDPGHEPPC